MPQPVSPSTGSATALARLAERLQCPQTTIEPLSGLAEDELRTLETIIKHAQEQHQQQLRTALQRGCPRLLQPLLHRLIQRHWP